MLPIWGKEGPGLKDAGPPGGGGCRAVPAEFWDSNFSDCRATLSPSDAAQGRGSRDRQDLLQDADWDCTNQPSSKLYLTEYKSVLPEWSKL